MTRPVLFVFDRFAWLLRLAGVDYPQFRAILAAKLTLDGRRRPSAFGAAQTKEPRNAFAKSLLLYIFFGLFIGFAPLLAQSPLTGMTIVHSFVMVMIAMALIADYSAVLLDTTDLQVLQPRPVSNRTILYARVAHIVTYLALVTLALTVVSFIVGSIAHGILFLPIYAVTLAASVVLVVGSVSVLYLLGMRFINEEKLRDIVLYMQIFMTVVFLGGYQLLPRLMNLQTIRSLEIADRPWIYFYPPTWMAGPIDLCLGNVGTPQVILTCLGLGVPAVLLLVIVRLAPSFKPGLITTAAGRASSAATKQQPTGRAPLARRLARFAARHPVERASFELIWNLAGRDRQFKLRTYPSVAFVFVFAFFMLLMGSGHSITEAFLELPNTQKHLFLLYLAAVMIPTAISPLRYSNQPDAAWMYQALPLKTPGVVLIAALKVLIVRMVVPTYAFLTLITLAIWGLGVFADVLLALSATMLACGLQAFVFGRRMPFSEPFGPMAESGAAVRAMLLMAVPATLGGMHYLLKILPAPLPAPVLVAGAIPFVLTAAWAAFRKHASTDWPTLRGISPSDSTRRPDPQLTEQITESHHDETVQP